MTADQQVMGTTEKRFRINLILANATFEFAPGLGAGVLASHLITLHVPIDREKMAEEVLDQGRHLRESMFKVELHESAPAATADSLESRGYRFDLAIQGADTCFREGMPNGVIMTQSLTYTLPPHEFLTPEFAHEIETRKMMFLDENVLIHSIDVTKEVAPSS